MYKVRLLDKNLEVLQELIVDTKEEADSIALKHVQIKGNRASIEPYKPEK